MSTIVYQGLQSCTTFESQIIETTTLKLKVSTPSSIEFGRGPCMIGASSAHHHHLDNNIEKCHSPNNNHHNNYQVTNNKPSTTTTNNLQDLGGWTFLQTLSNISLSQKDETTYVHPLSKRNSSYSRLSEKSLELCTESLGSETGTDISMESGSIFSFSSSTIDEKSPLSPSADQKLTQQAESPSTWSSRNCKVINNNNYNSSKNSCRKFPPPLTTIRSLNSLQFRPHREDGRLIIKAVEAPLTHNYLQVERSNGRLRLCFSNVDLDTTIEENEDLLVNENDISDEEEEEAIMEEDDEEEEESDMYNMKWDIDGNNFDAEAEMGIEKCQRLSLRRCKESGGEGNKVFCDWRNKPLWVATS